MNNKMIGCLIGGAIGDALGYEAEFKSYEEIIRDGFHYRGLISDDTQMTLFTIEALLNENDFMNAYSRWYRLKQKTLLRVKMVYYP